MKDVSKEGETPAVVPEKATQVGERSRDIPSEPCIWTERMLGALNQGVKGGKWFSLSDKAFSVKTLEAAFRKVKANGGSSGIDTSRSLVSKTNLEAEELPPLYLWLLWMVRIVLRPSSGFGFQSLEARRNGPWEFRRSATAWYSARFALRWAIFEKEFLRWELRLSSWTLLS